MPIEIKRQTSPKQVQTPQNAGNASDSSNSKSHRPGLIQTPVCFAMLCFALIAC